MEKRNVINLIDSIPRKALEENWVRSYDKELDFFTWTKKDLDEESTMVKVSNHTFLYISSNIELEGVALEYAKSNFIQHSDLVNRPDIVSIFMGKEASENDDSDETSELLFAKSIQSDIFKELITTNSVESVDGLVSIATESKEASPPIK